MRQLIALVALLTHAMFACASLLVKELGGKAQIKGKGDVFLLAEIVPGDQLSVPAGARLILIDPVSGKEYELHVPGQYAYGADGLRAPTGARVEAKPPAVTEFPRIRMTGERIGQAALVMRDMKSAGLPMPLFPANTIIRTILPTLRWMPVDKADHYRVSVQDENGAPVFEATTSQTELPFPPEFPLIEGRQYAWHVQAFWNDEPLSEAASQFTIDAETFDQSASNLSSYDPRIPVDATPSNGACRSPDCWREAFGRGITLQAQGRHAEALSALRLARNQAKGSPESPLVAARLGVALIRAGQTEAAQAPLLESHAALAGEERGIVGNDLGNLFLSLGRPELAAQYYREGIALAAEGSPLWLIASLNLSRLMPAGQKLESLIELKARLDRADDSPARTAFLVNLATQAGKLGQRGIALAHETLEMARRRAAERKELRLELEALDALSQLYEDAGRWSDVLLLTDCLSASPYPSRARDNDGMEDLLLQFEWRRGRAYRALGQADKALAAFKRATVLVQAIRQDLPIVLVDGDSSYRQIIEPLFMGYIDLSLDALERQTNAQGQITLRLVRDALESLRQSEMQDFLGERCSVGDEQSLGNLESGTAVIYPILLADRIEILVETASGLSRERIPLNGQDIRRHAKEFSAALRSGKLTYVRQARLLHDLLIRPIESRLAAEGISTLVFVADNELRLVPFGALRDDRGFLIERFALANVTGLGMTQRGNSSVRTPPSLLAGVSQPGEVVSRLTTQEILRTLQSSSRGLRPKDAPGQRISLRSVAPLESLVGEDHKSALTRSLALPGIREEIDAIEKTLANAPRVLMDEQFRLDRFSREVWTGGYSIVHIASHGIFGGNAETSFILAHDQLLNINQLQHLLLSESLRRSPIDLLTLSACETADGNDRAPLGIAGAAIRARARSVLGTLWAVDDSAATLTMRKFYAGLVAGKSKAEALRQAQIDLLRRSDYGHPFFWAPFSLIGNWR